MRLSKIRNVIVGKFLVHAPKVLRVPLETFINKRLVLIPSDQLEPKYREILVYLQKKNLLGDYLEFGVFNGTSLLCMHRALKKLGSTQVRMFGFDSFEGLPTIEDSGDKVLHWHSGQFRSPYEDTKHNLDTAGVDWKNVLLVKGWYNKTLTPALVKRHHLKNASIIMIDCDLYSSAKVALNFCGPLIQKESIILFDDWDSGEGLAEKNVGEKKAFDEFLAENPELSATEFGSYYHTELEGTPESKIFLVKRKTSKK